MQSRINVAILGVFLDLVHQLIQKPNRTTLSKKPSDLAIGIFCRPPWLPTLFSPRQTRFAASEANDRFATNQNGISAALQSHVNLTICPKLIWSVGIHQMFPIYGNISNSTQIAWSFYNLNDAVRLYLNASNIPKTWIKRSVLPKFIFRLLEFI